MNLLLDPVLFQGILQSSHGFLALDREIASSDDGCAFAQESTGCSTGKSDHLVVFLFIYVVVSERILNVKEQKYGNETCDGRG